MEKIVATEVGPLRVVLHSPTSAVVFAEADAPVTVNRVEVAFRADIGAETNPHSPNLGNLIVKHTSIKKVDSWNWEPSWNMREKVEAIALQAVTDLLADPALAQQVAVDKASQDLARAQSAVEAAQKALDEALQDRQGKANALNALLSASPLATLDPALVRG